MMFLLLEGLLILGLIALRLLNKELTEAEMFIQYWWVYGLAVLAMTVLTKLDRSRKTR